MRVSVALVGVVLAGVLGGCGGGSTDPADGLERPVPTSAVTVSEVDSSVQSSSASSGTAASSGDVGSTGGSVTLEPFELSSTDLLLDAVLVDGSVWVSSFAPGEVWRVDPASGAIDATIGVGQGPKRLLFDGTSIWVASELDSSLTRIDPTSNSVVATVPVEARPVGSLAFDGALLWVGTFDDEVVAIDPGTGEQVASVDVGGDIADVVFDGTDLWVVADGVGAARIDLDTRAIDQVVELAESAFGSSPGRIVWDGTWLWVSDGPARTLTRINPSTMISEVVDLGFGASPSSLASDGTSVWLLDASGSLERIDTNTLERVEVTDQLAGGTSITQDGENLWVTIGGPATLVRIRPD